ncbi:hypothetical protein JZ751_017049 [Albula glossodonta]|uniref:Uncharacterized protein n=1 Tax=Albula glossodonta TaxID=121402 RepID=A0A8T2NMM9_9TELE|nr:hypothetical protein JZ751_017049 [Albula glossodonta]
MGREVSSLLDIDPLTPTPGRFLGDHCAGLVAVGTRFGECLALSMLWDRHSYASRWGQNVPSAFPVVTL